MTRPYAALPAALLLLGATLAGPARAETPLTLATFAGSSNLPVWLALDKGYFAKEGLGVTQEVVRGSSQEIEGLMGGKYQIGTTAFDNVIAISEGQGDIKPEGYDLVGIMGVHSGMNSIVVRPEIKKYADLKGFLRIHNRRNLSGRCRTPDASVGSLSLRAVRRFGRAGVRDCF